MPEISRFFGIVITGQTGRWFRDNLQMKTPGTLQGDGFGKLLQNLRPLQTMVAAIFQPIPRSPVNSASAACTR